jgi:hypothetical protein
MATYRAATRLVRSGALFWSAYEETDDRVRFGCDWQKGSINPEYLVSSCHQARLSISRMLLLPCCLPRCLTEY